MATLPFSAANIKAVLPSSLVALTSMVGALSRALVARRWPILTVQCSGLFPSESDWLTPSKPLPEHSLWAHLFLFLQQKIQHQTMWYLLTKAGVHSRLSRGDRRTEFEGCQSRPHSIFVVEKVTQVPHWLI